MEARLISFAEMFILVLVLSLVTSAQALAQSQSVCQSDDVFADSFEADPFCPEPCLVDEQIQAIRDSADGVVSLPLEHVYVTYIRPTVGGDLTGFFLQGRNHAGPAIYASIDPAGMVPALAMGDVVSLTVTEVGDLNGLRSIVSVSDLVVEASEQPLQAFVQGVSLNTDLVSNIDGYESELISLSGTVSGTFAFAGPGFEAAILSTQGISDDTGLRLRIPADLRESLSLAQGCMINLCGTPMWRFNSVAQPSAWNEGEIDLVSCPAPGVLSAAALDANTVRITFDREIDVSSLVADGSQFVIDNGLVATAVSVNGYDVEVTTTTQIGGQVYQITVANSVTDTLGTGVDAGANSAVFTAYQQPAELLINELNGVIADGCDLLELRVTGDGTMNGIYLKERTGTVLTFSDFQVSTDDLIVIHFDSSDNDCNGPASGNETVSLIEQPNAQHPQNYDTAYDWYTTDTGITGTDNVLTLYHSHGAIMDALLVSDDETGLAASASETQAAEVASAGHWQMVGGGIPAGGFVDDNFNDHAVQDLNGTGSTATSNTIQRAANSDNNDESDWTMSANSWGTLNAGQLD